jgi:hypothetical protein
VSHSCWVKISFRCGKKHDEKCLFSGPTSLLNHVEHPKFSKGIQNLASKKAPGFFHIFSWDIWDPRQTALREHRWATLQVEL